MLMQRTTQQSLRKFVQYQPRSILERVVACQLARPTRLGASTTLHQSRFAATQAIKPDDAHQILIKQRLNRPVAPHLSIYEPQIPWILSALNRITGCAVSGGFYVFGFSYLIAPLFGWHLESGTIAVAFGSLPYLAKVGIKFGVALPFTFHCINGVRHLAWDTVRGIDNNSVRMTGWFVVGATFLSSGLLAFM